MASDAPKYGVFIAGLLLGLACNANASLDYAAWAGSNKDGSWTRQAERAVTAAALPRLTPADIGFFCPRYPALAKQERQKFWVGLLSAMAKPESNFQPQRSYREKFADRRGEPVISRGLLQISIESANQKRYSCAIPYPAKLHDPATNLHCGAKILARWVSTDGVIAHNAKLPAQAAAHLGGGRYWSVLRTNKGHLPQIAAFTRQLPFCQSNRPTRHSYGR
jgi:hypothetical protein